MYTNKKHPKTKKIYRYVNELVEPCKWCNGTGYNRYLADRCYTCNGSGGKWQRVRELVGEEVIEG